MSKHQEHIIAVFANKYNKVAEKRNKGNIYSINEISENGNVTDAISKKDIIVAQRATLEENPSFRQLIPYVSLMTNDGRYLTYTRTKQGNETRLHKKVSVGFGGHMDAKDLHMTDDSHIDIEKTIVNGLKREVVEELGEDVYQIIKDKVDGFEVKEFIIDNKTEVEEVHMALLITVVLDDAINVKSPDDSIIINGFLKADEIRQLEGEIEPWSDIVINK